MQSLNQILIVDDHSIVRHGLRLLIDHEPDLQVCGEAGSVADAHDAVRETKPDALIVDLTLKDGNGLELIAALRREGLQAPILVLSMHDEATHAEQALRAGANGYVMKEQADETVIDALRTVLKGDLFVSKRVSNLMVQQLISGTEGDPLQQAVASLTDREREVFECMGQGLSSQKIAEQLDLSIRTVEVHRSHIKQKLKADDLTQLVQKAVQWVGSLEIGD